VEGAVSDLFEEPGDATPLPSTLRDDLLPSWVTTRRDLNEVERDNIVRGSRRNATALLSEEFSKRLHARMFGSVWKWAGAYRQTELNIGIAPHLIAVEMPATFDDVRYWIEHNTYAPDETAVRLHHRLTQIHGFANGNGRHARLMADLLIEKLGAAAFTWGSGSIQDTGTLRASYVKSLQAADNHDIKPLLAFARS
jgi:Fic-DOC domain mobile mystery protein B